MGSVCRLFLFLPTALAKAVQHRAHGVNDKSVVFHQMGGQLFQLSTLQMNQRPTAIALAMETLSTSLLLGLWFIHKAGWRSRIHGIFMDHSLLHHPFQMAVHRCHANATALAGKMQANIIHRAVLSRYALQILKQFLPLPGSIALFWCHPARSFLLKIEIKIENHFHIIQNRPICQAPRGIPPGGSPQPAPFPQIYPPEQAHRGNNFSNGIVPKNIPPGVPSFPAYPPLAGCANKKSTSQRRPIRLSVEFILCLGKLTLHNQPHRLLNVRQTLFKGSSVCPVHPTQHPIRQIVLRMGLLSNPNPHPGEGI